MSDNTTIRHPATAATERIQSLTNQLRLSKDNTESKGKMSAPYKFQGWLGFDKESVNGKMKWQEYEPKTWTEDDVDIKITHCGVCASDLHTLRSGWVSLTPVPAEMY